MPSSTGKFIVGVIGTQNTGKSTFIRDLIREFAGTPFEFHTVGCDYRRKIQEAGLKINREGDLASQNIILDTLVEQLDIIREMPHGNYVTDRSPIDAYVYTKYLFRHNPAAGITPKDVEEQFKKVREAVQEYDMLVYIDLDKCGNVEVVDDKFRDTNLEFREEVDQLFKETFSELGGLATVNPYVYGSRDERITRFLSEDTLNRIVGPDGRSDRKLLDMVLKKRGRLEN